MNCFTHDRKTAVGMCVVCQKGVCHECVGRDTPRLVCRACADRGSVLGFEYRSSGTFRGWPLVHVCMGMDAVTMRPKIAKGVVAIGNIAIGGLAVGGVALGLLAVGGVSLGLAFALGGVALGVGLSVGGVAVGSIAVGGAAIGFVYAIGGGAPGSDGVVEAACESAPVRRTTAALPPSCQ